MEKYFITREMTCLKRTQGTLQPQGRRTSPKQFSPVRSKEAVVDGFNVPKARTKESLMGEIQRRAAGVQRAWHVVREVSGTWEALSPPTQKAAKKKRRKEYMTVFVNGRQKRIKRPPTIDGMDVDEFIRRNADPIWLHQNEMWEYMDQNEDDNL